MLFKYLKPVNSSDGRILVVPSDNSRYKKKRVFEKVMFFIDKENNNNFLTVYGVLLTVMIVKGIYDRDLPGSNFNPSSWHRFYPSFSLQVCQFTETHQFRSSHQRCFLQKQTILKNFAIFTENTCVGVNLLKRDSNASFLVNVGKFLRTLTLKNICERMLLSIPIVSKSLQLYQFFFHKLMKFYQVIC